MRLFKFEGEYSPKGCDVVCTKACLTYLVEIKTCNVSVSDADKAISQLAYTRQWFQSNPATAAQIGINNNSSFVEVFLHNKKSSCGMYGNLVFKQKKNKKVLRPNAKSPEWAPIISFARKNGLL